MIAHEMPGAHPHVPKMDLPFEVVPISEGDDEGNVHGPNFSMDSESIDRITMHYSRLRVNS